MEHAMRYALDAHTGQKRSGTDLPYVLHPLDTARILYEHGHTNLFLLQAALLHDTLEDTEVTYKDLVEEFGKEVADVVLEVTDDPTLTKKQQRSNLEQKIGLLSREACLLKVADCISNVRDTDEKRPANWNRSLKLAFAKTCCKVVELALLNCGETSMGNTFAAEVESCKARLPKQPKEQNNDD